MKLKVGLLFFLLAGTDMEYVPILCMTAMICLIVWAKTRG